MVSLKTRSPQIDTLLNAIEQYLAGQLQDEQFECALHETLAFVTTVRTVVAARVKVLPPTAAAEAETIVLQAAFDKLLADLDALQLAFEEGYSAVMRTLGDVLADSTEAALDIAERLESIESVEPTLSRSPFIDGLMKMAHAIDQGRSDGAAVCACLGSAQEHLQTTLDAGLVAGSESEADLLEQHSDALDQAFQDYWNGLEAARQFGIDGDTAHLHQGLEQANDAYERLLRLQDALEPAQAPAPVVNGCLRCCVPNAPQARVCQACGATLPPSFAAPAVNTVDFRLEDGYVRTSGHISTPTGDTLSALVTDVRYRRRNSHELMEPLSTIENKLRQSRSQLKTPDQLTSDAAELESLQWAYDNLNSGMSDMQEAIVAMRVAVKQPNPGQLDVALDAFLSGADKVARVQQAAAA